MKITLTRIACAAVLALTLCPQAKATDEIIRMYRSLRSQGMGGTWVTNGDYTDALFGNPARHVDPVEGKFSLIDLTLEANTGFIGNADDVTNLKGSGAAVISSIAPLIGTNQHARVGLFIGGFSPQFFSDEFGLAAGILFNTQANIFPHFDTNVDTQSYVDVGPHVGVAHKFLDDALEVGANLHCSYRISFDRRINALALLASDQRLSLRTLGAEGLGIDMDLGAYYRIPLEFSWVRFSTGITFSNLLMSTYQLTNPQLVAKESLNAPPRNDRTVAVGLRGDFPDVWIFKNNLAALEFTDIGSLRVKATVGKRVHMGMETQLTSWFLVRVGLNQGYPAGGVGFVLPVFRADLATWGEELGPSPGVHQDRRFGLRLAAEI